ncbi:oligosaccharide flippase family protein [Marinobacterium rhizophilum]|uniref:Oligosaccharide flippase family protein n=1 Tax=Marinobacterium rhizophilum TaxID=420402 RepID=A0ABY5HE54_9GAMM|nr:oligosaccharide flippase family protein [Marinobacterium rhizophilum]UTW10635.1 oligosaccharide flippase family protein [Marinobacterium rhizophilum]
MLANNHKRIMRNTGMLYMRMLLAMAVTLYTSRVVLDVLGIEDFGIYHLVVGFIALLGFLQGAMTTATQRYFAFDLGDSGGKDLSRIFNTSLMIHCMLAVCIALVAETAGYWFVSTQLTIPDARMPAAVSAYHLAVVSFVFSVLMVPFTAMLMAHERMGVFAAIGMVDVLLKLAAVIILQYVGSDKLIAYAWLLLVVSLVTFTLYTIANKLLFPKIKLRWQWHSRQFRTMLSYTAWNTWGNLAAALSGQGTNVLLNMFFGPTVNAGRSIASQANGALNSFVQNIQAAINPQIIKLYASGDKSQMHSLVLHASKYNFYLLFMLALPVLLNTEALLGIWLVEVPPYAAIFLQLTIINSLIESFSGPLMTSAQATGKIKLYQTIIGSILLLNLPISYVALLKWQVPEIVLAVTIGISITAFLVRLAILRVLVGLKVMDYIENVIIRSACMSAITVATVYALNIIKASGIADLIFNVISALTISILAVVTIGLTSKERTKMILLLMSVKKKIYKGKKP